MPPTNWLRGEGGPNPGLSSGIEPPGGASDPAIRKSGAGGLPIRKSQTWRNGLKSTTDSDPAIWNRWNHVLRLIRDLFWRGGHIANDLLISLCILNCLNLSIRYNQNLDASLLSLVGLVSFFNPGNQSRTLNPRATVTCKVMIIDEETVIIESLIALGWRKTKMHKICSLFEIKRWL
jgi:hypothetical protein